jgi:nitrite reductase/ring-hydroxylating ferredoxin subunit
MMIGMGDMMSWEKVLLKNKLPSGSKQAVNVGGRRILVLHQGDHYYAVDSKCPHWGLPLDLGRLTDDCGLVCPWHRSAFDLRTGDVKEWAPWPPGVGRVIGMVSRRRALTTFPTRVDEEGNVWVSLDAQEQQTAPPSEGKTVL